MSGPVAYFFWNFRCFCLTRDPLMHEACQLYSNLGTSLAFKALSPLEADLPEETHVAATVLFQRSNGSGIAPLHGFPLQWQALHSDPANRIDRS
jgi:hypothetical protein